MLVDEVPGNTAAGTWQYRLAWWCLAMPCPESRTCETLLLICSLAAFRDRTHVGLNVGNLQRDSIDPADGITGIAPRFLGSYSRLDTSGQCLPLHLDLTAKLFVELVAYSLQDVNHVGFVLDQDVVAPLALQAAANCADIVCRRSR